MTVSRLKADLVLQKVGLGSLPEASIPLLISIAEKFLKDFATFFYAKGKEKGTKFDPNHTASSARKFNAVLAAEASVKRVRLLRILLIN